MQETPALSAVSCFLLGRWARLFDESFQDGLVFVIRLLDGVFPKHFGPACQIYHSDKSLPPACLPPPPVGHRLVPGGPALALAKSREFIIQRGRQKVRSQTLLRTPICCPCNKYYMLSTSC